MRWPDAGIPKEAVGPWGRSPRGPASHHRDPPRQPSPSMTSELSTYRTCFQQPHDVINLRGDS